jgi:hypothetical protein
MEKIVISSNVRKALDELVDMLYYKEYFSYKKSAQDYINNLYDFILTIPSVRYKTTLNKNTVLFIAATNTMLKHLGIFFLILKMILILLKILPITIVRTT